MFQRWMSGLALLFCCCISGCQVLAHPGGGAWESSEAGQWSQWSEWTPCSAECRTGITARNRTCERNPVRPTISSRFQQFTCPGKAEEIKICNKQECPHGVKDWKEEQCSSYDSSVHSGRQYSWEPFTHPAEPCALTCRAKGLHFYTTLTERVVDGTPCGGASTSPSAICLQGVCEEVGCDDMLGSPWRRDACGVCKGDNSTCGSVSGVFTELSLGRGMNEIVVLPAGSTVINITGLQYSINWLALQDESGDYILNGGEFKSPAGDYEAAGTIFSYQTSQKCSGQCITAQGPINQAMRLMLKTRGTNRGVQYAFNVPLDVTDDYLRRIVNPDVTAHNTSPEAPKVMDQTAGESSTEEEDERSSSDEESDHVVDRMVEDMLEPVDSANSNSDSASEEGVEERDEMDEEREEEEGEEEEEDDEQEIDQLDGKENEGEENDDDDDDIYNSVFKDVDGFYVDDGNNDGDVEGNLDALSDGSRGSDNDAISELASDLDEDNFLETYRAKSDSVYLHDDDGDKDDKVEDEKSWYDDADDDAEDDGGDEDEEDDEEEYGGLDAGVPEPIMMLEPEEDDIPIIKQAGPEFLDFGDQENDAFTGSAKTGEPLSVERSDSLDDELLSVSLEPSTTSSSSPDSASGEGSGLTDSTTLSSAGTSPHTTVTEQATAGPTTSGPSTTQQTTRATTTTTEQTTDEQLMGKTTSEQTTTGRTTSERPATTATEETTTETTENTTTERTTAKTTEQTTQPTTGGAATGVQGASPDGAVSAVQAGSTSTHTTGAESRPSTKGPSTRTTQSPSTDKPTTPSTEPPQRDTGVTPRRPAVPRERDPARPALPRPSSHSGGGRARDSGRRGFRRPAYSQSFTFSRRHRQRAQPSPRPSSRHRARSRPSSHPNQPRIMTSRINTPSSSSSSSSLTTSHRFRISVRPRPQNAGSALSARRDFGVRNPYRRMQTSGGQQQRSHGPSQSQALTLGHGVSRDDDGFLTIPAGNSRSRSRVSPGGSSSSSSRSSSRQQREYARQQEQYRRELRRRRQQMERERAQAEYQRRLEEHNRKLKQRKLEIQRRRDHNGNQHQRHNRHRLNQHSSRTNGRHEPSRRQHHLSVQAGGRVPASDGATVLPASAASRTDSARPSTPAAPARERPTNPARQAFRSTSPTLISQGPDPPRFIPAESSSHNAGLHAASSSNEIPDKVLSPVGIGPQSNVVPSVNDRRLVIGGEGSLVANRGGRDKMSYQWRVAGLTECTQSCGGGVQQTAIVCMDTRTRAVVTNGNCVRVPKPEILTVTCNTRPCPAEWQGSQWSTCSASCGPGRQTRLVTCSARISPTLNLTRPEEHCQGLAKPERVRHCQSGPCAHWKIGEWDKCSVQCGEGVRTRDVYCVDQTGYDVSDDLCPGRKPASEEPCEKGPCGVGWFYTAWPQQCPARCGSGHKTRRVACVGEGGVSLPEASCHPANRPQQQHECRAPHPCGGQWFTAHWEQCNVTCGRGHRNREVLCVKTLVGGRLTVVGEENCNMADKPETTDICQLDYCPSEWYMTSWSQCSRSCDTGQRSREVKCLDSRQRASDRCPLADKPRTREACSTEPCLARPSVIATTTYSPRSPTSTGSSECKDVFSRCEIVRHARMCRYPFYKEKCCATCALDT